MRCIGLGLIDAEMNVPVLMLVDVRRDLCPRMGREGAPFANPANRMNDAEIMPPIYRVTDRPNSEWFWGVSFDLTLTGEKSYGRAPTREEAMAAVKAEYLKWRTHSA